MISCSFSNQTPLHWAAYYGHVDVCQPLVSAKSNAAARDMCDATPLAARAHDAVRLSRAALQMSTKLFVVAAAPPLKFAINKNNPDVIVFLRSVGAPE